MNIIFALYTEVIYKPLFNALVLLYNILPGQNIAVAIIILTILVRLVLYKFNSQSIEKQRAMQEIQPKIKEIQKKYKHDQEKQAKELLRIYREHHVSPVSGCLPLLIQLPVIVALYSVFRDGFKDDSLYNLYNFVANPGHINAVSFGVNLSTPNVFLAVLAAALQFWQTKELMKVSESAKTQKENSKTDEEMTPEEKMQEMMQAMTKNMMYVMPLATLLIGISLPAGMALYWSVNTLFAIVQQYLIMKKRSKEENSV